MNKLLYSLYYHREVDDFSASLHFLKNLDYTTAYFLKYPLTLFYFLSYFTTSYFAVRLLTTHKKYATWVIYIYALLLVLSGISMGYNYIFNNQLGGNGYTFSRWLMGIAQSPLVAFFVIASGKLFYKFQLDKKQIHKDHIAIK